MLVQVLDCDYIQNNKPIIRIFGKTEDEKSVCLFYENFFPYFYVEGDMEKVKEALKDFDVIGFEVENKFLPFGYQEKPKEVLKIILKNPGNVGKVRDFLLNKKIVENVYEADILFKYRFMVDHGIFGISWIDVDAKRISTQTVKIPSFQISGEIKQVKKEENAKMKYLSLDIECLPLDDSKLLDPKDTPIIMISFAFDPPFKGRKHLVILTKNVKLEDIETISVQNEKELLQKFLEIVDQYDPDIITGYNINNFDLPFILERLRQNNLPLTIGRCNIKPAFSKKIGLLEECTIPGRVVFDPYQVIRKDPWLRFKRYDLNTVVKEMLGEEKIDIKYNEMRQYWNGDSEKLKKFILYSKKDAELPLRITREVGLIEKFFELSKVSGLLLQDTFGGQASRIEIRILHEFKKRNILMPCKQSKEEIEKRIKEREKYGLVGAIVLEPKKGLYRKIVLVLDFTSLYPSIIRTYNISPDTIILDKNLKDKKFYEAPNGAKFIDESIYMGVMPSILDEMIKKRAEIKKELKKATGEKRKTLEYTQLALKTMANSFYGYTGFVMSRLYMLDIANAITAIGRENLLKTKKLIEEKFPYKVIYADTDSIFLETDLEDLGEARRIGEEVSKYVTESLPGFLELKFEKIFKTFLILTKKRYAGWAFEPTDGEWKEYIDMKGIETVRRDWCELTSEVTAKVIELILKKEDIKEAIKYVKDVIQKLKRNEIPFEKLAIVKGITKPINSYKGTLPHIELAKKLAKRHPENPPKIGDRLSFIIVEGTGLLSERAETIEYAKENNLKIDANYYITSQILPPIERILRALGVTKSELMGGGQQISIRDLSCLKEKESEKEEKNCEENFKDLKKEKSDLNNILEGWEIFVCEKCGKTYKTISLTGLCSCGGKLIIKYNGFVSKFCRQKM
jgi:DNA polymerase I